MLSLPATCWKVKEALISTDKKKRARTIHMILGSLEVPEAQTETMVSLSVKIKTCWEKNDCFQEERAA